jgi:hypothetical protein
MEYLAFAGAIFLVVYVWQKKKLLISKNPTAFPGAKAYPPRDYLLFYNGYHFRAGYSAGNGAQQTSFYAGLLPGE